MELTKAQKSKLKFIDKLKAKFEDYPIKWGFEGLGYVIYKRTYARKLFKGSHDKSNKWLYKDEFKVKFNIDSKKLKELIKDGEVVERTEEWHETTARTLRGAIKIGTPFTKKQLERLFQYSMDLKYSFSGRFNWQADTRLANSGIMNSLINCYYFNIDSIESITNNITRMFDLLMLGGGCGFSVEKQFISKIAPVKTSDIKVEFVKNLEDVDYTQFNKEEGKTLYKADNIWNMETGDLIKKVQNIVLIVADSREGWVKTLDEIFKIYFETPYDEMTLKIDTTLIREKGEDIEGFGGTASGDQSLIDGLKILIDLFEQNRGKQLNSVQWTDVVCIIGDIVVSGNVRRTALIASSDITDIDFMNYKRYDKFVIPEYRKNVNITIVCNDVNLLPKEFWETYEVKGEAIGLLNRDLMQKYGRLGNDNIINDQKYFKAIQEVKAYNKVKRRIDFYENKIEELEKERELIEKDLDVFAEDSTEFKDRLEELDKTINQISDLLDEIEELYESEEQYLNDRKFYHNGLNRVLIKADPDAVGINPCSSVTNNVIHHDKGVIQIKDLQEGDSIWDGNKFVKVKKIISRGLKDVYRYTAQNSKSIDLTRNHKVLSNGDKFEISSSTLISSQDVVLGQSFFIPYDIIDFKIIKENYVSTEEVVDILVDSEEHLFWCNGFIIFNCGEANLESGENCNLYTIAGSKCTEAELNDLLQLMHLNSKTIASKMFLYNQDLVNANLRVGGDISGIAGIMSDFQYIAKKAYENLRKYDRKLSKKLNLPESIKLTVQKPSGTIALLLGIDAGIHLSYSPYWFRTVRFDSNDKLLPKLQTLGYRIEDAIVYTKFDENGNVTDWTTNPNTKVVYFACEALNKNFTEKNVSAIEQMELNKIWQSTFVDQSISQTVKFQFEDLDIIKEYLKENYNDNFKTISFMIFSNGNFAQQPYQEITKEEFESYNSKVVPLSKEVLDSVESTKMLENFECEGGVCPIK
jgi:hypothetical protein